MLGRDNGIDVLPIVAGQSAIEIARARRTAARLGGYDVVMFDTAGRITVDDELMAEVVQVKATGSARMKFCSLPMRSPVRTR